MHHSSSIFGGGTPRDHTKWAAERAEKQVSRRCLCLAVALAHSLAHADWNLQKAAAEKAAAEKAKDTEPKEAPKAKARGGGE